MATTASGTGGSGRGREQGPVHTAYHDRLPLGQEVSAAPLLEQPLFGFTGEVHLKPLEPMLAPERPRSGETDPSECWHCTGAAEDAIWRDEHWQVAAFAQTGLPFVAGLAPREHLRLDQLGPELLATFGEVVQRLAGAIQSLDSVARTHFSRWGDGSAHFHLAFLGRPLGMMQGRGPMLPFWDDVLPPIPEEMRLAHARQVATALARRGGEALLD